MLSRPLAALNMRLAFLGARAARDLVDLATKVPRSPWMVSRFGSQSSASVLASICSRIKRLMMSETIWKSTPRRTDPSKHVAKCSQTAQQRQHRWCWRKRCARKAHLDKRNVASFHVGVWFIKALLVSLCAFIAMGLKSSSGSIGLSVYS